MINIHQHVKYDTLPVSNDDSKGYHNDQNDELITTEHEAFTVTLKSVVGTGFLALPFAMKESGWIGLLIVIGVYYITTYTTCILIRVAEYLLNDDRDTDISYNGLIQISFAGMQKKIVLCMFMITQIVTAMTYLVLIDTTLTNILVSFSISDEATGSKYILGVCCVVECLLAILPSPAFLSGISSFGNFAFMSGGLIIAAYCFTDGNPSMQNVKFYNSTNGVFINMSISCFMLSAHAEILSLVGNCSKDVQKRFESVTRRVLGLAAVILTSIALIAYLAFGDALEEDIFDNIRDGQGSKHNVLSISVKIAVCLMVLCNFPLVLYPLYQAIELHFFEEHVAWGYTLAMRWFFVISISLIALSFGEHFGMVSVIVGAFTAILSYVIPPILYIRLYASSFGAMSLYDKMMCSISVTFGVACLILSVRASQSI